MSLTALASALRAHAGLAAKRDVAAVNALLGAQAPGLGDDCAAIPDGDGYLQLRGSSRSLWRQIRGSPAGAG